eukprot:COSAG01_NODE_4648_length_4851_cov_23.573653_5_plen_37_part_01
MRGLIFLLADSQSRVQIDKLLLLLLLSRAPRGAAAAG